MQYSAIMRSPALYIEWAVCGVDVVDVVDVVVVVVVVVVDVDVCGVVVVDEDAMANIHNMLSEWIRKKPI